MSSSEVSAVSDSLVDLVFNLNGVEAFVSWTAYFNNGVSHRPRRHVSCQYSILLLATGAAKTFVGVANGLYALQVEVVLLALTHDHNVLIRRLEVVQADRALLLRAFFYFILLYFL